MQSSERGWKSTKLHLAVLTMALITGFAWMTGFKETIFDAYCMALLAAAGIYSGSHTFEKLKRPTAVPGPTPALEGK